MPDASSAMFPMRIQRFLARAGKGSRRTCDEMVAQGRVKINGETVTHMGAKVKQGDLVELDDCIVELPVQNTTIMLNKPAGFVTTMGDPHAERIVAELVADADAEGLFPVGRLDKDTTGLLLFTNDGELANRLMHPSSHVQKRYIAEVRGVPDAKELEQLRKGVKLEDGLTAPADAEVIRVQPGGRRSTVQMTIHEGRKRQVKRMLEAVGHPVEELHRESIGNLQLGDLETGRWRELTEEEMRLLTLQ